MATTDVTAPAKRLATFATRILDVQHPSESLVIATLERPAGYEFEAGQFLYVHFEEEHERRAYSIASSPHQVDHIQLCVKKIHGGPVSSWVYGWEAGARIHVSKALGGFAFRSPPGTPVVFLATGTGIAPLRSMYRELLHRGDPREMWLFLGARERANLPYHDETVALTNAHPNFRYVPTLSGSPVEWEGSRGWIQEPFVHEFRGRHDYEAYLCGVKRMVDDVSMVLQEQGVPLKAIHMERYT